MTKIGIGNTYGTETVEWKNGQKRVWREIRHRFPAGGTFSQETLTAYKGKVIPSGTPVTFDQSKKTLTVVTGKESTAATIDGFTQEDAYIKADGTYAATTTVAYDGEIYEPVLKAAVLGGDASALAAVKKGAPAGIKFVQ